VPDLITIRHRKNAGLWTRLTQTLRSYWTGSFNLKDPALNKFYGGGRSQAGPLVNEFTMFMCAAVYDAINQIGSDTAKLPLNLKKRRQGGGTDDFTDSKTYRLMKYRPNAETSSMQFRRQLMVHALVSKGGYAEIVRDGAGRPIALWNLEPHRVEPFYDEKAIVDGRRTPLRYRYDGEQVFEARDILHIHGIGWDGVTGFEMVNVAREAIGLALASQQFAAAFFGNGTRFGGVLSSDQDLDPEQKKEIREEIEKLHAKADKAFRLLVLGAGFKFDESGVKPNEAQMKEIRDQQVAEVARFYNMPLHKLKLNTPGAVSYASVEMADLDYYKGTLLNWLTVLEEEYNAKLIPSLELGIQYFKHNANAFLRGDIKSRYDALGIARDKGIINADEWRELEDMNPQPDGQGKVYLVQSAQIPVDKLAELVDAQIAETKQKAKPPEPPPASPGQAEVDAANARAASAEQLAADAQVAAFEAREKLAAAEATGTATASELAELRESFRQQQAQAGALLVLSEQLRERVDLVQAAKEATDAIAAESDRAKQEAEARAKAAEAKAEAAAQEQAIALAALVAARDAENAARFDVEAAHQLADEAEAKAAQADSDKAVEAEARAAAERMVAEAQAVLATLSAERADLEVHAEEQAKQAEAATNEMVRLMKESSAQAEARQVAEQAVSEQAAKMAEFQSAAEELDAAKRAEAEARAETERVKQELAEHQAAHLERMTKPIAAHRALILDAMGRLTRREAEQARKRQATPEKLRKWLDTFRELHEAFCEEALLPVLRVHVDWKDAEHGKPHIVTANMVRSHLDAFDAQIRAVLAVDPEEFHETLAKVLHKWETEHAESVADTILREAIEHVQSYQR